MGNRAIDEFLKNANMEGRKTYKETAELMEESRKRKIRPCKICTLVKNPDKCGIASCYAWYEWFRSEWRNIQKAAKEDCL